MKQNEIKKALNFLTKAQAIIEKAGEESFEWLGLRKKQEIFDLAFDILAASPEDYRGDGDTDGVYLYVGNPECLEIEFDAHSDSMSARDVRCALDDMRIWALDYRDEDVSIEDAIRMLNNATTTVDTLALLNTSIVTTDGTYTCETISLDTAKRMVQDADQIDSAIGHQATADIMATLLGINVPVNRQIFVQEPGQQAIVFKLRGRPQEGKILTADEIETIGYDFKILTRVS